MNKLKRDFYPCYYDLTFKCVFGRTKNKSLTCNLYNLLNPDYPIDENDIDFVSTEAVDGVWMKSTLYDIRFDIKADPKIIVNYEMQKDKPDYNYLYRNDIYCAKMITSSIERGEDYNEIKKIYTVCFSMEDILNNGKWYTEYRKTDIEEPKRDDYPWLRNIIIQLKYRDKCDNIKLRKVLDIIASENPKTLKGSDTFMDELIDEIIKVNTEKEFIAAMIQQEMKEMDDNTKRNSDMRKARKQGLEEGLAQGLVEGRAEGLVEGRAEGLQQGINEATLKIAKALKASNTPIDVIVAATGLSKEEVVKL
jgi:predicted transposase/invertase (TIGR01784 family)